MDTRAQGFIQRTLKTFGSPFRFKRLSKPHKSGENGSGTQTKTSPTTSIDGKIETSPDLGNVCLPTSSFHTPPSEIKVQRNTGSSIAPNRQNVVETHYDDNLASIYTERKDEDIKPQISEGPARVITIEDGSKKCLAILLTEEMVSELFQIKEAAHILQNTGEELNSVKWDIKMSQCVIEENKKLIQATNDREERERLDTEIIQQETLLAEEKQRKADLKIAVGIRRGNLEVFHDIFQSIFIRAFEAADLLHELRAAENTSIAEPQSAITPRDSVISNQSEESLPGADKLFRRMIYEDIKQKTEDRHMIQALFARKEADYQQNLYEYLEAVEEGEVDCSRTVFDNLALETIRNRTTALIEAEAEEASAVARGRALGLLENNYDQESGFVDDLDDGYAASDLAAMAADFDTTFIEAWNNQTEHSENSSTQGSEEPDEWDAESVGISDSVSCVDFTKNRRRIDRWREICEN